MKLAVLSDIHANLPALEAVLADIERWQPDHTIVAGDIINRGPRPAECLRLIEERVRGGWMALRGNHEDYVLNVASYPDRMPQGIEGAVRANVRWTLGQIGGLVSFIADLPDRIAFAAPDGSPVRVVHASMIHSRDCIFPETGDDELRAKIAPPPALFVCAHTHRPLIRQIDSALVVNVGAAGLPFDGDMRVSYGRLTWDGGWRAEIARVAYDRDRLEDDFVQSGYLSQNAAVASLVLDEFRRSLPRMGSWYDAYKEQVLAGELTVEESVERILASVNGA